VSNSIKGQPGQPLLGNAPHCCAKQFVTGHLGRCGRFSLGTTMARTVPSRRYSA